MERVARSGGYHPLSEILPHLLSISRGIQLEGLRALLITSHLRYGTRAIPDPVRVAVVDLPVQLLADALYDVVCDAIRVDSRRFREKEVKLVFSKWHGQGCDDDGDWTESPGPCLGFVNGPLFDKARSAGHSLLTISAKQDPAIPFYEAVKRPAPPNSTPKYAVLGIWLPCNSERVKIHEVGAIMINDDDEHDAVII